jgi:hypothetical protein
MFTEDFTRFKNGNVMTITFNGEGEIQAALMFVEEFSKHVDVTDFVRSDKYWQSEVDFWLYEYRESEQERKYWDMSKEVVND